MTPSSDYSITPSTGKLKLKGVKDSKVNKKKKKKKSKTENEGETREDDFQDRSVMLKMLEEEDRSMAREKSEASSAANRDEGSAVSEKIGQVSNYGEGIKTEAERRYDEQRRKRLDDRLKREGVKTHKQRVEELNRYLSGLSEHHDMPRIGPG